MEAWKKSCADLRYERSNSFRDFIKLELRYKEGINRLIEEYRDWLEKKIKEGLEWRDKIENNKLSEKDKETLLRDICVQILIQGRSSKGVKTQIKEIEKKIGKWSIENLESNLASIGMSERKREKLKEILSCLKTHFISEWIIKLHRDEIKDKKCRMGLKSDDDFLKDHGFYEHIPIDRHTQRFMFRTGIIHWYLKLHPEEDILNLLSDVYEKRYKLLRNAIIEFCKTFCKDINIQVMDKKLNLAENPGILDILIWRHGGEDEELGCKNICGKKPKCEKCVFKHSCLHYLLEVK